MSVALLLYAYLRRTYPTSDAGVVPEAVATLLETILDIVFLSLLQSQHSTTYFAVAVTGFGCHFLINTFLVGGFLHHEFRSSSVRSWAEHHHSFLAPVVLLSLANPELLGILCARIGTFKFTSAPFSRKGLDALRFSTFAAFIAGKTPQLAIQILLLNKEGWHLDAFLASVTTLTLLAKGTIHYLVFNLLQLYKKRRGGTTSKTSQGSTSQTNVSQVLDTDVEKMKLKLASARRKVKELEDALRKVGIAEGGESGVQMPLPAAAILASSSAVDARERRKSLIP
ncbi:hypothetical protein HK104_002147 [Borealophlyctis nickersoniae]|nr:hypothetical protein HK104_002147 [Borealophlyctis nickersoniae]